jgi:hypothetical protein
MAISLVTLTDHKDEIRWKWTKDGCYNISSTYEIQFLCSLPPSQQDWYGGSGLNQHAGSLVG